MKAKVYLLRCLTNLHVGGGDSGYSVIGNEVEKDAVLHTPTIHASGMKGALRAQARQWVDDEKLWRWFGSEIKESQTDQQSSTPGSLRFLSAQLLARPVRVASGEIPYVMATSKEILQMFQELLSSFGFQSMVQQFDEIKMLDGGRRYIGGAKAAMVKEIEGPEEQKGGNLKPIAEDSGLHKFFQETFPQTPVVILPHQILNEIELPVAARNQLENGISKNLWYEEFVPHESVFYTFVLAQEKCDSDLAAFDAFLKKDVIQIGGNASVGYGYIKVIAKE